MKVKIPIGEVSIESEVIVKEYASGIRVVESGDATNIIKGQKPIFEKRLKVSAEEKKELFEKPDNFEVSKGRLVRKGKKK